MVVKNEVLGIHIFGVVQKVLGSTHRNPTLEGKG